MLALSKDPTNKTPALYNNVNLIGSLHSASYKKELNTKIKLTPLSDAETASLNSSEFLEYENSYSYDRLELSYLKTVDNYNHVEKWRGNCKQKLQREKYKTELCKNYMIHEQCSWNENCFFAHGKSELRSKTAISQYCKTKICKSYHKGGFCPYGSRCQYFHLRLHEMNQQILDYYVNKISLRISEPCSNLNYILINTEKTNKRLPIYNFFSKGYGQKSFQEKFLDNDF